MNQTLIKVYDPEQLLTCNPSSVSQLARMDFTAYQIRCEVHKLAVLENENLILFSLLYDKFYHKSDYKEMIITLFKPKTNNPIMAIKCQDKLQLSQLSKQFQAMQTFQSYMGPLAYQPIRKERTSLLSTESPEQNFRGFINLAFLILIANHIRLILENFRKYGLLMTNVLTFKYRVPGPLENPHVFTIVTLAFQAYLAYLIQVFQFSGQHPKPSVIRLLNIINITLSFIIPGYLIQGQHPFVNLFLLGGQCILSMKLISYAHVMRNAFFYIRRIKENKNRQASIRDIFSENEVNSSTLQLLEKNLSHPERLVNFKHFLYFIAAPTLCFQFTYLRSPTIRKVWLVKRIAELVFVIIFQIIIWFQYVEPLVENTYRMLKEDGSFIVLLDRLLKLAIPNTYIWLAFFFGSFQCWLNITAELLRFADREFYKDWWNCKNLGQYWRLWNLPVHHWMLRHLYFPLLKQGVNKAVANTLVFLVSALGHEYLISVSMGIVGYIAFLGMLMQAPVILASEKIEKVFKLQDSQLGNLVFWCSFCFVGQPLMIFVYYFRYLDLASTQ